MERHKGLGSLECVRSFIHSFIRSVSRPLTPMVIQKQSEFTENDS